LAAKGTQAQWSAADAVNWTDDIPLPAWLPRKFYAAILSQIYYGEWAMSRICQHLLEDNADPLVRQCIKSFSSPTGNATPRSIWLTWKGSAACHLSNPCLRRHPKRPFGGIRPIALMEDYDFIRRLEEAGETVCIEDRPKTPALAF